MSLLDLIQVSVVEAPAPTWPPNGPLFGDDRDHARAFEAGLASVTPQPEERSHSVGLVPIVRALLGSTHAEHWPAEAWRVLGDAVDADLRAWIAAQRVNLEAVPEVVDAVVRAVRRVLAPAREVGARYAPVAVLLGSRLRLLSARHGAIVATWQYGPQTTAPVNGDLLSLADTLVPHWNAPHVVQHADGRTWNAVALRIGETVAWHDLSDRSVLEIAAFESWHIRHFETRRALGDVVLASLMMMGCRRDLGFALAEAAYRNLLPTADELRIAADLAEAQGVLTPDAIDRWTLVELWARCMPLLWAKRGDRTL